MVKSVFEEIFSCVSHTRFKYEFSKFEESFGEGKTWHFLDKSYISDGICFFLFISFWHTSKFFLSLKSNLFVLSDNSIKEEMSLPDSNLISFFCCSNEKFLSIEFLVFKSMSLS
ncbi:hypothetical protein EDEG_04245, partial [Edhazardia aedis USNM 41457]